MKKKNMDAIIISNFQAGFIPSGNNPARYNTQEFCTQLKKMRIYRGYIRQSRLASAINVSRQIFSLWELGKRLPTMEQLVLLANFLRTDICYFFIPGASPEEYERDKD